MVTTIYPIIAPTIISLKRILLEKSLTFSSYQNTATGKLYFCGRIETGGNGDFMYGNVWSGDVETYNNDTAIPFMQSNLIYVDKVYKYGTTSNELNADCALSDDNLNLMVTFSTNFHTGRPSGMNNIWTAEDFSDTVK